MKLEILLTGVAIQQQLGADVDVRNIQFDSRLVESGDLFVATRGTATDGHDYINKAITCYNWYNGQNSKKLCLIDNQTGACYDGICKNGLNLNQGSESIVSFGMSFMKILNLNNN